MPKLKTKKSASKRFTTTGGGKLARNKAFASHIMTKKSRKRKRGLRKPTLIDRTDRKRVTRMLPYV
jgi:large subunit ribosomal protein L35